jgi:hypothetical protein
MAEAEKRTLGDRHHGREAKRDTGYGSGMKTWEGKRRRVS